MAGVAPHIARVLGVGLLVSLGPVPAGARPAQGEDGAPPRCPADEKLDVMALVYNAEAPERSLAMVALGRNKPRLVSVGSYIAGRVIVAIRPRRLWLGPDHDPCWMPLSHEGDPRIHKRNTKRKRNKRNRRR